MNINPIAWSFAIALVLLGIFGELLHRKTCPHCGSLRTQQSIKRYTDWSSDNNEFDFKINFLYSFKKKSLVCNCCGKETVLYHRARLASTKEVTAQIMWELEKINKQIPA